MKNKYLLINRIFTGLLTMILLMSVGMYLFQHEMIMESFTKLGYPTYIIYPLAIAKILGLLAIWTNKSPILKRMAYTGFFFNFILAFSAHIMVGDGESMMALVAIFLLIVSYVSYRYVDCEMNCKTSTQNN